MSYFSEFVTALFGGLDLQQTMVVLIFLVCFMDKIIDLCRDMMGGMRK